MIKDCAYVSKHVCVCACVHMCVCVCAGLRVHVCLCEYECITAWLWPGEKWTFDISPSGNMSPRILICNGPLNVFGTLSNKVI